MFMIKDTYYINDILLNYKRLSVNNTTYFKRNISVITKLLSDDFLKIYDDRRTTNDDTLGRATSDE